MAESRERGHVGALISKLESKICYHRDATVEYMEIKTVIDEVVEEKEKLRHEKMEFLNTIDIVVGENQKLQHEHHGIRELVAPMEQQLETVREELEEAKKEHEAVKEELMVAKEQLALKNKELDEKNEELQALRKKLQESEVMDVQLEQQHGSASEPVQSRRVTRSAHKREMLLQGLLGNDADRHCPKKQRSYPQLLNNPIVGQRASRDDDLEVVRQKLIKGFTEIDAGRYLGVKEMGKLNEKPFRDACAEKLPPKESGAETSRLYILWQELLNNPKWNPFKAVTVDGNRQEVIDVDDDKLQELKMAWGEGPYNSVISALVERKEYKTDGTGVFDLWNYKEGRKATLGECVEHIFDKVKQFKRFRLRTQRLRRNSVC